MSARTIPSLTQHYGRMTLRCDECKLVQFKRGERCLRCKVAFEECDEPLPEQVEEAIAATEKSVVEESKRLDLRLGVGGAIKLLRVASEWSQGDVAEKMGWPRNQRSRLSRMESGASEPQIRGVCALAEVFEITPYGFLLIAEAIH